MRRLAQEIKRTGDERRETLKTIYFGGGSPALCDLSVLTPVLRPLLGEETEFTVELHPLDVTEEKLRELIVRENALEFFEENHRYFDVKHWKLEEIGTEILGGPKTEISIFRTGTNNTMDALISYWDAFAFDQYWHPKMFLEPFNQSEVNKGIIAQNPGY